MKKQALLFLLLSSLVATGCNNTSRSKGPEIEDLGVKDFHTELMNQYLQDPNWENIKQYVPVVNAENSSYHDDQSQPNPIKLEFAEVEATADNKYYVEIAKNAEFSNAKVVEVTSEAKAYNFYNSELGQEYYFRAAVSQEALAAAKIKKFKVTDVAPRFMHVDGVINFRDAGGWKSSLVKDGVVKQGMYYRCAQFNSGSRKNITEEGLKTIKELNIKVDIDMRDSMNVPSESPINTEDHPVEILKGSVASGSEDGRWEGDHEKDHNIAATYKKIFEAIAVADEKPIALHCTHGADRTGIVSWFLLGLLGVSKEDCARDYVMTRFAGERAVLPADDSTGKSEIAKWNAKTEALEGATWAEKTYKHLNEDFGISVETLETIRTKFVAGYKAA